MKEDRRGQFAPREDEATVTSAILERPVNQKHVHTSQYTCTPVQFLSVGKKTTSIDLKVLVSISTTFNRDRVPTKSI